MTRRRQFRITFKLLAGAIFFFIVAVLMAMVTVFQLYKGRMGEVGLYILVGVIAFVMAAGMLIWYRKRIEAAN